MAVRRGTWLIVVGAGLLLVSATTVAYSRFGEWQHELQVRASAPPAEVLPDRLAVPSLRTASQR